VFRFVFAFLQGIYNYIPVVSHVYRLCYVTAILWLRCMEHIPMKTCIIIIIIIIIIIFVDVITFLQGIYNYIPETARVSRVYIVADVLYLQFVLHIMFFRP
jgi:hypothetical protein